MSMKPILYSVALALASAVSAAPKAPKAPKAQLKEASELKACEEKIRASSEDLSAAAQCQLWIAEQSYAKFTALKLPKAYDRYKLSAWLEDSKKQRKDTSALYLKVKDFGEQEQSVTALARIGLMSYQFATNLQRAPMPEILQYDLNGDGISEDIKLKGAIKKQVHDAVREQLEMISAPIREDALEAFEACVQEATDNKVENSWSKLCAEYVLLLTPPTAEPAKEKEAPSEPPAAAKGPEATFK